MNLIRLLQQTFRDALTGLADDVEPYVAMVRPAQDARFGDYQANCAMSLAKALDRKPRDVAQQIAERLNLGDMLEKPEVAGPGFINLRLRNDWLAAQLQRMAGDERLGVEKADPPRTVVIDYSSPNVAKPMHVGHLRSTIIGDAITRLYRFLGHRVVADNHLGDWGTQFGMLLYGYKHFRNEEALQKDPVREMVRLYQAVRKMIKPAEKDEDDSEGAAEKYSEAERARAREISEEVRRETARLHAGDPENVRLWESFMPWCLEEINRTYRRLDVHFDCTLGESFYNPMLADIVSSLEEAGIAQQSEGAVVVFGKGGVPSLVRKRDGAFTYTTTDLATIRYRMETWRPDSILYVVGAPQALHFQTLFATARRWGYDRVELKHIPFGSVLDPKTRKPISTREGGTELNFLLDEAVRQADAEYMEVRAQRLEREEDVPELHEEERRSIAEAVGIGAVKYADLSQNPASEYAFNLEKMLAMDGNTATYMQYAYARNRSIFRKGEEDPTSLRANPPRPSLETPQERALALELLRFEERLTAAAAEYQPNGITSHLWDVAKSYSGFFQNCPVLKAPTPELRRSRLLLCDVTARTIQLCLSLLGIRTLERM